VLTPNGVQNKKTFKFDVHLNNWQGIKLKSSKKQFVDGHGKWHKAGIIIFLK